MRSLTALAALSAAAALLFVPSALAGETDFLNAEPAEFKVAERCLNAPNDFRREAWLTDDVYDQRFHWVEVSGQARSVLIEFERSCRMLDVGRRVLPASAALCAPRTVYSGTRQCRTQNLYVVPNEAAARDLALRIQLDRARAGGASLPEDNRQAADALRGASR
ncbi:hypothetical protein F1654_01535 [Alkalicaulis satelles]|uniref:Uncharacterized protein n=1 Tax=Alkalicaulis satelles TaxID=2609175 RepID=A0A5M6ZR03_9PROT|nr:hypothetical protein [Alkalicaulis satelles]KAA5804711.1 hypothetical protein F1654_01535 [Alkalicaulis satelles]